MCSLAGLIMALTGGYALWINFNASGLVMAASIMTVWGGLALLVLIWNSACQDTPDSGLNHSVGSAIQENAQEDVISNCLSHFGKSVYATSVVLLESTDGLWRYMRGWNCSSQAGNMVAVLLFKRVNSDSQDLVGINVMGVDLLAFCTPIHCATGNSKLLVVLSDLNSAMPHNIGYISSVFSFTLIKLIEGNHPVHYLNEAKMVGVADVNQGGPY